MFKKPKALLLFTAMTTVSILGITAVVSKLTNAQTSSQTSQTSNSSLDANGKPVPPLIVPSQVAKYVVLQPGTKITGRLGLPAAQLIDPPAELAQEIAVWVPEPLPKNAPSPSPNEISYQMISSTRYRGNGHTIFVTTARPSPAAAKLKHHFGQPTQLADGTEAGVVIDCALIDTKTTEGYSCVANDPTPNRVQFMRGNLIITIASDLPIEQVKSLAKNASLK